MGKIVIFPVVAKKVNQWLCKPGIFQSVSPASHPVIF